MTGVSGGARTPEPSVAELPSWPWELLPQHKTPVVRSKAHVKSGPAATWATPATTEADGVDAMVVAPKPSWPTSPVPQQYTVPSKELTAQQCEFPQETSAIPTKILLLSSLGGVVTVPVSPVPS
jgi:hypothetical protein